MAVKQTLLTFVLLVAAVSVHGQRPSDPALMIPQKAPALDFVAAPADLKVPDGITLGASASVAFNSHDHMILLNRGPHPVVEFDTDGKFVRAFGETLFRRAHGLRIDKDDNIWVTDVGGNIVVKFSPTGEALLKLGTAGELNEPNDLVIDSKGNIFIVQGHSPGKGDPRVLKYAADGKLIKSWGGEGTDPGKFNVAHGIALDAQGQLWVADRENQRIQIFDTEGQFMKELKYAGLPCGLQIGKQYIYMVNGFASQLLRLDLSGKVLAATGSSGTGLGQFGEAHAVAVSPKGEIFVADTVNSSLTKFIPK